MNNKRGYTEIIASLFLIILIICVTIGLAFYQKSFLIVKYKLNQEIQDYSDAYSVRQRLSYCYGMVMRDDLIGPMKCRDGSSLDKGILEKLIRGYEISVLDSHGCRSRRFLWNSSDPAEAKNEFVYYVAVRDTGSKQNCLARLKVKI